MSIPRGWLARLGLGSGLLVVALAVSVLLQPGGLRGVLVRALGPPQVVLKEVYASRPEGPAFDHTAFDVLLLEFVDERGFVDYAALGRRRDELDRYLDALSRAPFDAMGRNERLALLINAYNAFTLRLILDYYPLDSIRDIPANRRWDDSRWNIAGRTYSLNEIEHEQIRPMFREPRIHFALVCAAVGCPMLRREAYVATRVDEQLDDQSRRTHENERWVRYESDANTISLTSLYEWYAGDFEQVAGSILDYAARYRTELARDLEAGDRPEVRFLDYDWSLNAQHEP